MQAYPANICNVKPLQGLVFRKGWLLKQPNSSLGRHRIKFEGDLPNNYLSIFCRSLEIIRSEALTSLLHLTSTSFTVVLALNSQAPNSGL